MDLGHRWIQTHTKDSIVSDESGSPIYQSTWRMSSHAQTLECDHSDLKWYYLKDAWSADKYRSAEVTNGTIGLTEYAILKASPTRE